MAPQATGALVHIQRLVAESWVTIKTVTLDRDSLYRYRWTADVPGVKLSG
ncbi:MAG: hypothetical protein WKF54_03805 [Nocardioidaceae bacterium]